MTRTRLIFMALQWIKLRRVLLLTLPVGIVAGLGSVVFYVLLDLSHNLFLDHLAGFRPMGPAGEHSIFTPSSREFVRWMLLVVPTLGGILSGFLVFTLAPEAEGHGTDSAIEAFHFKKAIIRPIVPFVKIVASAITIGTGGSGGREGPIAQIGAGFGSIIATRLGLTEQERRVLMMAGMSAGIGSIFHAPLAGAIFAAEILYRDIDMEYELLVPSAITSVIAYCVFSLFFGFGTLFITPSFQFQHAGELFPYTILAVAVALAGNVYARIFYGVRDFFAEMPILPHIKPALGGLLTGLIGYFIPDALYTGYGLVQRALDGNIVVNTLVIAAIARMFTTAFSIGSGGSGGVFGPSVVIGGSLGGAAGMIMQGFWPNLVPNPEAYAIVGMAGFFASAASTPFSTVIMVSEMTGNYELLLPSIWVCTLAFLLKGRKGLYEKQLMTRYETPIHKGEFMLGVLGRLTVQEALVRYSKIKPKVIVANRPVHEILKEVLQSRLPYLPVIDEHGKYLGVIERRTARRYLRELRRKRPSLKKLLSDWPAVYSWHTLDRVLQNMASKGVDEAVVLSERRPPGNVVGILRTADIIRAYRDTVYAGDSE